MRRICRALASLAMGVTLAAATTAAAPAMPSTGTQDPHDQLAQREALYQSEPEHNLATARAARVIAAQPAARTDPAAPSPGVDVFATLLVGLVGGLLGGAAATVGWTAATRRRLHRPAAGT
jgi:hypothetical protein